MSTHDTHEGTETTHEVVTYELRIRLMVDVPVDNLKQYGSDIDDLQDDDVLDIIVEDTDLIPDALAKMFDDGDFTTGMVDVDFYDGPNEVEKKGTVELRKPRKGALYTLPVPNLISGNVIFTEDGIVPVEVSNVNVLSDDQLEGAYYAAKRIWGLRGMHRYQKEQIAEMLSELQWAMLARPSRHVFRAGEDHAGDDNQTPLCSYCGQPQQGHLVRADKDQDDA